MLLSFQTDTNLFDNNFDISLNNVIQFAYAQQEYKDAYNEDETGDFIIDDKVVVAEGVAIVINNN